VDLRVEGDFDTAVAATFTDAVQTEGRAHLDVTATGDLASPRLAGFAELENVTVAVDEPEIVAQQLNARVDLAGDRVTLSSLSASVNGGTLTGSGGFAYREGQLEDVNVQLATRDFAFDAPLDLRSLSDSTIVVTEGRDDELLVTGKVLIREAGLTGDVNFDTGLLATLGQPRSLDLTEARNPLLQRVAFNIQVLTTSPILVDNNLARAEVRTNLRVLGSPYEPGLTGTLTVAEGGEITLNERRYEVERGTIAFLEERRIVPSFDLRLHTSAGNYDVTLAVTGEPGNTESTLTSNPTLPEPDIMALLVTGRTLDQMRGEEADIAKEQVLSYLAGRVGSELGRGIEQATGLSDVRLEPNLIANETDPSARLTVGQELTDELQLIYSTDLADSSDQVWVARYDVTRRFQANAVRQPEGNYRVDFRHDVRFGGRPSPRRLPRARPRIATLDVVADGVLPEAELRDRFGLEAGDAFDYFAARDGVERIERALQEQNRLQSRVRLERRDESGAVALTLEVEPGPPVHLSYRGTQPPSKVDREVRRQWNRGVFDAQRVGDAVEVLREWLIADRYFQSTIDHELAQSPDGSRQVSFVVTPGPRSERIEIAFAGASAIDPSTLDAIVDEQDLELSLFTDPVVVTELLERYYREEGFLSAQVDEPRYEFDGPIVRAVLAVREGPRFVIRDVSVRGNRVIPTDTLLSELPLKTGDPFLPRAAASALDRTRELYWRRAYNDMRVEYALALDRTAGTVEVGFEIEEGRQSVIADLRVAGHRKTSDRLVAEQLEIAPGEPLDLARLGRSRRNLYDTGAFSMVDITREPVEGTDEPTEPEREGPAGDEGQTAAGGEDTGAGSDVKPVVVNVRLREVQPVQLQYGASFDTEHGFGGVLDLSNHNTLGKARVLGLAGRYDASLREGRVYFTQPKLRYWPISTTASVYYTEERNAESQLADPFNVDRFGVSVQQERMLANRYLWNYGYRWERARKFAADPGATGETVTVAPLTSTFTREARDEVLDASRGSFTSHGFSYSPTWLGADTAYIKYLGQYFHYFPLEPQRRTRFTNEILRPRFVFATGIRLGLARGFGDRVPETERFYAGGSTTLRGFEQNAVGPVGPDRIPTGGEALLVLNNEVRYPLFRLVDGVGFLDIGNVYDRLSDFDVTDLRETAGVGIRVRTPWFLIRGDYGIVLDQRPGERRGRFYFSIGQAF
jgi:outer membrane protein assembly factor BamA